MAPTTFSTSAISTMTIASQGQPSRKHPSGPLLTHFLHPMQRMGSTSMRPNGGLFSSGTQNMQSSTGQYSTHPGDPAQPVQHSVMTASSLGFFLRGVVSPLERGSCFSSSGTIPADFTISRSVAMARNYTLDFDFVSSALAPALFHILTSRRAIPAPTIEYFSGRKSSHALRRARSGISGRV